MSCWLLVLIASALAGSELSLTAVTPVVVDVDGQVVAVGGDDAQVVPVDVGMVPLRVQGTDGAALGQTTVETFEGMRTRLTWDGQRLRVGDRIPIPSDGLKVVRDADGNILSVPRLDRAGRSSLPELAPAPRANTADPLDVLVDGAAISADVYSAAVLEAGQRQEPPAEGEPAEAEPIEVVAGPTPDPTPGAPGSLELVHRTTSWANAYVDGALVEFRGDSRRVLELTTGPHDVVFRDFRDRETWYRGEVVVYPDLVVELQFGEHAAPRAVNRPEAWRGSGQP